LPVLKFTKKKINPTWFESQVSRVESQILTHFDSSNFRWQLYRWIHFLRFEEDWRGGSWL